MDRPKKFAAKTFLLIAVCSPTIALVGGAIMEASGFSRNSSSKPSDQKPSRKALDIVFQGAWAFVQNEDGSIRAITPEVEGHTVYPYIRALNEAALRGGGYSLGFKPDKVTKTIVDSKLKNSAPPNLPRVTVLQQLRFISFQLPEPTSIVVLHTDKQVLQDSDPDIKRGYDKKQEKDYATIIAFRYLGSDFSTVDLLNESGTKLATLDVPQLGYEGTLFIGVQPAAADEDHSHAKLAFRNLVKMFPPLNLYANFDSEQLGIPEKDSGIFLLHHSGADCYAAMLYVDCSSKTKCTIQPLQ